MSKDISLADLGYGTAASVEFPVANRVANTGGKKDSGVPTSLEDRVLHLLGSGISAESAAAALGVTPSRISQLLSEESFSQKVSERRYQNLQKHNERDSNYDTLEDTLITKLESSLHLMHKPTDILRALNVVNKAVRRGQSAPEQVVNQQNIVNLVLPSVITQRFAVNIDNQVIRAGEQELHTMPASSLLETVEKAKEQRMLSSQNSQEREVAIDH